MNYISCVGCDRRLPGCIERYAYRQLFPGGFLPDVKLSEVIGLSSSEYKDILRKPYESLPRFDAGVHIRAQTGTLEKKEKKNHTELSIAMETEYKAVFHHFEKALEKYFFINKPVRFNISNISSVKTRPRVYVSCDDVDIRDSFVASLLNRTAEIGQFIPIYVNASEVKHTKHMDYNSNISQVAADTAFDWYALSLSNACFGWRTKYTGIVSTFLQSASRVSIMKPTKNDFKATILLKGGKWHPTYEPIDDISTKGR